MMNRTASNVTFFLVALVLAFTLTVCAKADTLRIGPYVPAVPGIESNAPRYSPYPGPTLDRRPSARVIELYETAPGNACGPHAFEVISGPRSGRGCFGSR